METLLKAIPVVSLIVSICTPFILAVINSSLQRAKEDRREIIDILHDLQGRQADFETRLTILEHDFADVDPHPSRHKRPA